MGMSMGTGDVVVDAEEAGVVEMVVVVVVEAEVDADAVMVQLLLIVVLMLMLLITGTTTDDELELDIIDVDDATAELVEEDTFLAAFQAATPASTYPSAVTSYRAGYW